MSKLTRFTNGKVSNGALNAIANTAGMIATALTLTTAVAIAAPAARADYLYSDPYSYDTFGDRPTYNNGGYTELDSNDWQRSNIHDSTLKDRDGNLYDCNNIGQCSSRW